MEVTILDGIVGLITLVSAILAYARGFVREILAIGGWIVAAIVAFIFTPNALPLMQEIPIESIRSFMSDNGNIAMLTAFFTVFALMLVVFAIFAPYLCRCCSTLGAWCI